MYVIILCLYHPLYISHRLQDERRVEVAAKADRKADNDIAKHQKKRDQRELRRKAIQYFSENKDYIKRMKYCNILQPLVLQHVLAFGGKV